MWTPLVGGNFRLVLQGEADIIQSIQQAMAYEFVDGKFCLETLDRRALRNAPGPRSAGSL